MKCWPLIVVLSMGGCASVQRSVVLSEPEAALSPVVDGTPLGENHSTQVWGYLGIDSLVLYRHVEEGRGMGKGTVVYRREAHRTPAHGVRIGGYTATDGTHVPITGWVKREGDSLRFEPRPSRGMEAKQPRGPFRLATADVRSVDVWVPDRTQTGAEVLVAGLVVTALLVAAAFSMVVGF